MPYPWHPVSVSNKLTSSPLVSGHLESESPPEYFWTSDVGVLLPSQMVRSLSTGVCSSKHLMVTYQLQGTIVIELHEH